VSDEASEPVPEQVTVEVVATAVGSTLTNAIPLTKFALVKRAVVVLVGATEVNCPPETVAAAMFR